ncbi:transporter substrate-binding domain-containing protein [Nocardia fluminea]
MTAPAPPGGALPTGPESAGKAPADDLPRIAGSWHPWRWVVAAIALLLVAQFAHGLITNPGWDRGTFAQYFTAKSVLANIAEGLPSIDIAYYQQSTDYYLALASQRIDGYIGPNPAAVYHSATSDGKIVATFSGAGEQLQGEIAALTKKDNGLIGPIHKALQHAIADGSYQKVLDRWGLASEKVTESRINPPGLPKKPAA